jgi:hypothetical protein
VRLLAFLRFRLEVLRLTQPSLADLAHLLVEVGLPPRSLFVRNDAWFSREPDSSATAERVGDFAVAADLEAELSRIGLREAPA